MADALIGPIPYMLFLDSFHPVSSARPPLPKLLFTVSLPHEDHIKGGQDSGYYRGKDTISDVCRAINTSQVCSSIEFLSTENICLNMEDGSLAVSDCGTKFNVGASGMTKLSNTGVRKDGQSALAFAPDWERMRVTIQFKLEEEDIIFDRESDEGGAWQSKGSLTPDQLTSDVRHQFSRQCRTSVTSILILERWARLIRHDHAGTVVSGRFDWRANDGALLAEFLSRLEYGSPQQEGVDDSVGDLSVFGGNGSTVVQEARKAMQEFTAGMIAVPLADDAPLRSVECWDDSELDSNGLPRSRTLIATKPLALNLSVVSRYTVSFIGYDVEKRCAYWIKDSWPINDPEFTKEGEIYKRLKDAGVPHLAEVECAGEVRWKADNAVQRTRTNEFSNATGGTVHPLSHYRILFKDIGRPVYRFESTKQMVTALSHAIKAHSVAYEKAHMLHRDISPGNILIKRNGDGMLIDWDLSLYIDSRKDAASRGPRMLWRTGTWAFASVMLLSRPFERAHSLSDDLESFFWVLLFLVLRYRYSPVQRTSMQSDVDFQSYMLELFESKTIGSDGITLGGRQKRNFLADLYDEPSDADIMLMKDALNKFIPRPLSGLIITLRKELNNLYEALHAYRKAMNRAAIAAKLAAADADEETDDDDGETLPRPARLQPTPSSSLPPVSAPARPTLFDAHQFILARFDEALSAKWPRRGLSDSSVDRIPSMYLPVQQKLSSAPRKDAPAPVTLSDDPVRRRVYDLSHQVFMRHPDQVAEYARERAGGDYITISLSGTQLPRGQKRKRESTLESIPEEREPKMPKYGVQAITLRRQDAGPPNEVLIRNSKDGFIKDAHGFATATEAWSAPPLRGL
ncbi:unnamed protein product [Peniophora sp. CBMAI 1063]|nr:unnamed protein product [Peniophora sp. CBMAI 1063]